jgi:hypothetical protein
LASAFALPVDEGGDIEIDGRGGCPAGVDEDAVALDEGGRGLSGFGTSKLT